jgi:hypothetical protein
MGRRWLTTEERVRDANAGGRLDVLSLSSSAAALLRWAARVLLVVLWVAMAGSAWLAAGVGQAVAQTTCTIDFTVPYNSATYTHVMSETVNSDELYACDTRYPAADSGMFPNPQPIGAALGTSTAGGSFKAQTNAADNTVTYTPPTGFAGVDTFTLYFCDTVGCGSPVGSDLRRVATVMATVTPPTITLAPTSLPGGTAGVAYNQTVTASGGASPYTFSISDGILPVGLSINSSTGAITGTPTEVGTFNFTVSAADSSTGSGPFSGEQAYAITVGAPSIGVAPISLSSGTEGVAYGPQLVTANGGTSPYSFAVTNGSLPAGMTLSATGSLSGTPTANGTFNITITATDATTGTGAPFTGDRLYALVIAVPPVPVANAVSATVAANSSATPISLNISGGTATSVAVATAASNGTATASGTSITYTPNVGYSGSDSFTYTATNGGGTSAPATVTITVSPPILGLTDTLADGYVGVAYSGSIAASLGTAPYTFAVTLGSEPPGLTLASDGNLSGTPTTGGTFTFTVTATDSYGATGSRAYSVDIQAAPIANAVSATVAANSSATAITLDITGGTATSVAVDTGAANGTATASGTSITYTPVAGYSGSDSFTYTASNGAGTSTPATVSITVSPPTLSLTDTLADGYVGAAYSGSIAASLGTAPYTFAVTLDSEPPGLTLASDGTLSGTPTTGGTFTFTVTATDAYGATGSRAYSIEIVPPPIANAVAETVPANSTNVPITLDITGGAPDSVAVAGAAAHGTATASGTSITYTPVAGYSGSDSFTYTASNAAGSSAPATVSITVSAPTLTLSNPLAGGTVAGAYNETVTVSLGTAPYALSLDSGTLPGGLALAGTTLSGVPTAAGTFNFTLEATDSYGATGTQSYSVTIDPPSVSITVPGAGSLGSHVAHGGSILQVFAATGGVGPHTFLVTAGSLPPGTFLSVAGTLTGVPTTTGSYSFSVVASDASGTPGPYDSAAVSYTIEVVAPTITVTPATLGNLATAAAFNSTLSATGGNGPYTFSLASGALPAGTTLTPGGIFSGTPVATDSYGFGVTATDAHGFTGTTTYNFSVEDPVVSLDSPADGPLPPATAFVAYSETFAASGGIGPHTFELTGTLPAGLTLTTAGLLSGTPTVPGSYSFSVLARDASPAPGPFDSGAMNYTLEVDLPLVTISTGSLPDGVTGQVYSATLAGTGGTAPYSFAVTVGGLPPGLDLAPSGLLSGTPTTDGQYNFTVEVTDDNGATGDKAFSITVDLDTAAISDRFNTLARNFMQTRQQLLGRSIQLRGLGDRPGALPGTVTTNLTDGSQVMGFATSLSELRNWGAGRAAETLANGQADAPPLEIWVDAELVLHARGDESGQFALASMGAEYRFSDSLLAGVALYGDWMSQSSGDGETSGQGYLIGPYISVGLGDNLTFDASLLYGQSWNESSAVMFGETFSGDFDTTRWAAKAKLEGTIEFDLLTVRPRAEMFLSIEEAGDYIVRNETGTEVVVEGVVQTDYAAGLAAEFEYAYDLGDGLALKPQLGVAAGVDGDGSEALAAYGTLSLGFELQDSNWGLSGVVEAGADSGGLNSVAVKGDFKLRF